ncbi:hypothetical protein QQ7_2021, partial [Clostridioides difficile Y307]
IKNFKNYFHIKYGIVIAYLIEDFCKMKKVYLSN